ncbi:hypothetical protein BJV74DRAFT_827885 [Russula compacta]|nr:hypothetical protein BJV74DRAFT_827885 [Russula compacta]
MAPLSSTQACRKYVDLINRNSGKFVNWDPQRLIEVGDFGYIDRESGQFVREGNIYRDEPLASIAKDYAPIVYEPVHEHKVDSSTHTRMSKLPDFGDLSGITYTCQWRFRNRRAAFLVMLLAREIIIPSLFLDMALNVNNPMPELRTKNIVTSVWSCPSFAMYLSNKSREHVKVALRDHDAGNGNGQETGWYTEGNVGVYQFGSHPNGNYLPLFRLQKLQKTELTPRRGTKEYTDAIWVPTRVPWSHLDEDGVEPEVPPNESGE